MKQINKILATLLVFVTFFTVFNIKTFAYSEIPEYFDFGDCVVNIDAGSTKDVWLRSNYNYTYFLGPHSSQKTYLECSYKAGSEYVRIHIGPDETTKNVFFYFYVDDDKVQSKDIHDCIEVYVQNIDYEYAKLLQDASVLKSYSKNSKDFNAYNYFVNYKDLQNAFGIDGDALYNHYITCGINEKRIANKLLK